MTSFKKDNQGSTQELFRQRANYLETVNGSGYRNIVNLNFGERIYYGRVGYNMAPMVLDPSMLVTLNYGQPGAQNLQAMNFVKDIFEEMARQFDKAAYLQKIATDDPYLSSLRVYRAYVSPYTEYEKHRQIYFKSFKKFLTNTKRHFSNVNEFMAILMEYLSYSAPRVPFTFPAFIKSGRCSVMTSGLALEIADLSLTNDKQKIEKFLQSRNWQYFVNACNEYGFRIDQDVPWRIIMDIGAQDVHPYSGEYDMYSTVSIINKGYQSASIIGLLTFGKLLLEMYNFCSQDNFSLTEECGGDIVNKVIEPSKYTLSEWRAFLPPTVLAQYYLHIRLLEQKPKMKISMRKKIVQDVISMCRTRNNLVPIGIFFEGVINKEFDKMGSLQYYYESQKIPDTEEMKEYIRHRDEYSIPFSGYVIGAE